MIKLETFHDGRSFLLMVIGESLLVTGFVSKVTRLTDHLLYLLN